MKAVVQTRYGSANDLCTEEVAVPAVGDHEVLVRVHAASLHPDVWHVVTGRPYLLRVMGAGLLRPKNPIPGTDMAGVVESIGSQVTRFRPGDEVFGETVAVSTWMNGGAFAEYVAISEELVVSKPANVTFEQAASVPSSGMIAMQNLPNASELGEGREVLINGAGGGVGSLALQIVKSYGARVTAVDGTNKLDLLRTLGADRVIDYTCDDLSGDERRYDLILDVASTRRYSAFRPLLTEKGRYVPIGHDHYGKAGRRWFGMVPYFLYLLYRSRFDEHLGSGRTSRPARAEVMATLRDLLEAGEITPIIDSSFPLEEVREAFRHLVEDDLLGKVMVVP